MEEETNINANTNNNNATKQEKQNEISISLKEIKENNIKTQIKSNETMSIGKETIQALSEQNEQLINIETLTDHQSYILEKGDRTLRNMTWSGWLYNKFTSEPMLDNLNGDSTTVRDSNRVDERTLVKDNLNRDDLIYDIPTYPEDLPKEAKPTAQATQNYHCNILLLKQCSESKELKICIDICERHKSNTQLCLKRFITYVNDSMKEKNEYCLLVDSFVNTKMHLDNMLDQYKIQASSSSPNYNLENAKKELMNTTKSTSATITTAKHNNNNEYNEIEKEQINHINTISNDLKELTSLSKNINTMILQQSEVINNVIDNNECNIEKTKLINRRVERITRRSQMKSYDPVLYAIVTIQHMPSKEFLTIDTNNNNSNDNTIITFNRKYSGIASRFSLWKIPHQQIQKNNDYITIGVQSCLSNKWITKSKWNSNIYCASATFKSREEFEMDLSTTMTKKTSKTNNANQTATTTMIMCCSANYGNGGYIVTQEQKNDVNKKLVAAAKDDINGALWQIQPISS